MSANVDRKNGFITFSLPVAAAELISRSPDPNRIFWQGAPTRLDPKPVRKSLRTVFNRAFDSPASRTSPSGVKFRR